VIKFLLFVFAVNFSVAVFATEDSAALDYSKFADRTVKEYQKVVAFNYKFQTVKIEMCKKTETVFECFQRELLAMNAKDKLSIHGLVTALPAGKQLIIIEKNKKKAANPKLSNSDLSLESHKKQTAFALLLLKLSCTAATPKDWGVTDAELIKNEEPTAQSYLKTLKKVTEENIEQVRKYSNLESSQLQVKFEETLRCEKK